MEPGFVFLSTLSLRRATISCAWSASKLGDFYPRSPCGERQQTKTLKVATHGISIHALLAESDSRPLCHAVSSSADFYPRSPCGERLVTVGLLMFNLYFYPRSPCGERQRGQSVSIQASYFYPRSPCGERRITIITICTASKFLSTLSLRRATYLSILL